MENTLGQSVIAADSGGAWLVPAAGCASAEEEERGGLGNSGRIQVDVVDVDGRETEMNTLETWPSILWLPTTEKSSELKSNKPSPIASINKPGVRCRR